MLRLLITLFLVVGQMVSRADEAWYSKPPEKIEAAFAAPAEMRSYSLDVQAIEPRWLYEKQLEDWFPIKSFTSYVARIVAEPTPISGELEAEFEKLAKTSEDAKKEIETGPLMGPKAAYVIFNSKKKPVLIVYRQFQVLWSSHPHSVSGSDTFQAFEGWTSYNLNSAISEFLEKIEPKKRIYETPFTKWKDD